MEGRLHCYILLFHLIVVLFAVSLGSVWDRQLRALGWESGWARWPALSLHPRVRAQWPRWTHSTARPAARSLRRGTPPLPPGRTWLMGRTHWPGWRPSRESPGWAGWPSPNRSIARPPCDHADGRLALGDER